MMNFTVFSSEKSTWLQKHEWKTVASSPMPAHPQPFSAISDTWHCPFNHLSACSRCALSVAPLPGTAVHAETKVLLSKEALRTFKSTQQILKHILWTQPWTRPKAAWVHSICPWVGESDVESCSCMCGCVQTSSESLRGRSWACTSHVG